MKILAITTGQGQRKDQSVPWGPASELPHLRAELSPDSALVILIRQVCWKGVQENEDSPSSHTVHPVHSELQSSTQSGWDWVGLDLMSRMDTGQLAFPTLGSYCREKW